MRNVLAQQKWTDVDWIGYVFLFALRICLRYAQDENTRAGNQRQISESAQQNSHARNQNSPYSRKLKRFETTLKGPLEPLMQVEWLLC